MTLSVAGGPVGVVRHVCLAKTRPRPLPREPRSGLCGRPAWPPTPPRRPAPGKQPGDFLGRAAVTDAPEHSLSPAWDVTVAALATPQESPGACDTGLLARPSPARLACGPGILTKRIPRARLGPLPNTVPAVPFCQCVPCQEPLDCFTVTCPQSDST